MKILLLNDNPVVRKLVALSAQKTKDELSVIWSVDEVEGDSYDLLIVDDAHYSDESMAALKEKIKYKTSLLMATRGNTTHSGFEKVINKPFLPTDLVDLFSQINKDLSSSAPKVTEEKSKAIVLDDVIEKESAQDEDLNFDDFDFDEEDTIETAIKTNVLDHEEVQELQDLLDDTDNFDIDDDILKTIEDESLRESAENDLQGVMEEFDFDEELLGDEEETPKAAEESFEDEDLLGSLDDLDALLLDGLDTTDEEKLSSLESAQDALSDDEFDELEQQIQEAVEELGFEDLEQGIDEVEDLGDFESFGDLDSLSERDIKLAIGEEVEDEEAKVSEEMEESLILDLDDEIESMDINTEIMAKSEEKHHHGTPAEGMDALQALLKALSNEDVAKTLKGLSINININFGNEK